MVFFGMVALDLACISAAISTVPGGRYIYQMHVCSAAGAPYPKKSEEIHAQFIKCLKIQIISKAYVSKKGKSKQIMV